MLVIYPQGKTELLDMSKFVFINIISNLLKLDDPNKDIKHFLLYSLFLCVRMVSKTEK